jgi:hypothetical protein
MTTLCANFLAGNVTGLPDGIHIFIPKIKIWVNLRRPWWYMYFMAIWNILRPFDTFCGHSIHFPHFLNVKYVVKNLATL